MLAPPEFENRIIHGDCLEVLRTLPDASVDSVVTDPPYGLGTREPTGEDIIAYLKGESLDTGGDFMGHDWEIPSVEVWKECLRVLKPGGYVLAFAGTRTWDIMSLGIRAAGFDNRDTIASMFGPSVLSWVHCLPEDTEVLTETGWRHHRDLHLGDAIACWDPATERVQPMAMTHKWEAPWDGPMSVFRNDDVDCVVTPNHRVYHKTYRRKQVDGVRTGHYSDWEVLPAAEISRTVKIKIPTSGFCEGSGVGGEDYAELVAWIWTEGGMDNSGTGVRIYQSETANPENVQRIDALLDRLHVPHSRYSRDRVWVYRGESSPYTEICWYMSGDFAEKLRADLPDKVPSWSFIWRMTMTERRTFYETCMAGDGSVQSYQFYQKGETALGVFQATLALMGYSGHLYMRPNRPGQGHVNVRTKSSTELTISKMQETTEEYYKGTVWCIEVPTGAFVVRRNGQMFITGNSQGFPKSLNIAKAIRKIPNLEQAAELAKIWEGWGTALKPAWEPVLCFRSPTLNTISEQVAETGTGGMNIDGTRIKHASAKDLEAHKAMVATLKAKGGKLGNSWKNSSDLSGANEVKEAGRWPANALLVHSSGCKQVGTQKVAAPIINRFDDGMKPFGGGAGHAYTSTQTGDSEGKEEVPIFECMPHCPVRRLNEASSSNASSESGASRYFAQFVPEAPFYYAAKASRSERNAMFESKKKARPNDRVKVAYYRVKEDVDADIFMLIQEAINDQTEKDAIERGVAREKVTPVDVETFSFERALFEHLVPEDLREHFEVDDTVGGNDHPSVKPIDLMRYLVRLVTPKGGLVLDLYCGSGTTCQAATEEGMRFIGIEKDPHFYDIAYRRVMKRHEQKEAERGAEELFDLMGDLPQE